MKKRQTRTVSEAPSGEAGGDWARQRGLLWLAGGSVLATLLVCYFFSPRFVLWRGLGISEAWFYPEVNRAVDTLRQLQDPFVKIDNPSNAVIAWRLFFPLTAHLLHFPDWLFLALPHVGCLFAVGYVIHIVWRRTGQWTLAFMAASTLASADWFFVSMGWLAYFDSWFVLGLLVVSFSSSRVCIALACLTVPWIDERFVLALPLCGVARSMFHSQGQERGWKSLLIDATFVAGLLLPYVGARVLVLGSGSTDYIHKTIGELGAVSSWRLAEGLWAGFRAAWFYLAIFAWGIWRIGGGWRYVALTVVCAEMLLGLVIAADMSRNLAMLTPAVLVGCLLACESFPRANGRIVATVMAANLLLPASHVGWTFTVPMYYVYHELAEWQNPPAFVNPAAYVEQGMRILNEGNPTVAKRAFDNAIRLSPDLPDGWLGRGVAELSMQDFQTARVDVERGLSLRPSDVNGLYFHGLILLRSGETAAAAAELRSALAKAPPDWPNRRACRNTLDQIGWPK